MAGAKYSRNRLSGPEAGLGEVRKAEGSLTQLNWWEYAFWSRELIHAAGKGDRSRVEQLLAEGVDPNTNAPHSGETPLYAAASGGQTETVQLLLTAGANPSARCKYGVTPLHVASNEGTVQALLTAGADLSAQDDSGQTPLHLAVGNRSDCPETLQALLSAGADPNAQDNVGRTTLHGAATWGQKELVEVLLQAGANPNAQDNNGYTPLYSGCMSASGNMETIQVLLEFSADPNTCTNKESQGRSAPLHMAAMKDPKIVQLLLTAGADRSARDVNGNTPLHYASNPEIVQVLLKAGEEPNVQNTEGETPLHYAAGRSGNKENVPVLLIAGADLNAQDNDGNTPLHRAVGEDSPECVVELLRAGADSSIRNIAGETAEGVSDMTFVSRDWAVVTKVFQGYKDITPHIPFIIERVGLRWRDLASRLGFSPDDIDGIAANPDNHDDKACCRDMLEQWQRQDEDEGILKLHIMRACLSDIGLQDISQSLQERLDYAVVGQMALLKTREFLADNMDEGTVTHFMKKRGCTQDQTSISADELMECVKTPEDYDDLLHSLEKNEQHFLLTEIKSFEWKAGGKDAAVVPFKPPPHHSMVEDEAPIVKEKGTKASPLPPGKMKQMHPGGSGLMKQRIKLILLGQTGSGKTSLCLTMLLGKAHIVEEANRTIGVDILSYIDEAYGIEYKIYDFGGHDVYHYTHRFFLTHFGLYLLCVDLPGYRSGEFQNHVGKWMTSISSHVTKPSLIVVGTKSDEGDVTEKMASLERDIKSAVTEVRQALEVEISRCQDALNKRGVQGEEDRFIGLSREEVLNKKKSLQKLLDGRPEDLVDVHVVPVSSKRNEGIAPLRSKMAELVQKRSNVSSVLRGLPKSWSDFGERLKEDKVNTCLSLQECQQRAIELRMGLGDVVPALDYLHVTGDILFYRHIQGMENMVFQDPSIILKLFKQLFRHNIAEHLQKVEKLMATDRQQFLEGGIVSDKFVDAVLPEDARSFQLLLPLMKHFGLCFNRTVTMMANVPIASEEEVAARWSETYEDGTKEVKLTMKSLDVNSEHPIGLGESLTCRIALMSEEGRRLVKRNAVINRVGNTDVMYHRLCIEEKPTKLGGQPSIKTVDEICLRADSKQTWRRMKELVNKIQPCLEEYRARLSEDRVSVTLTEDKKVESIPLEALHKHTDEDLDMMFLGEWMEPTWQPDAFNVDRANKHKIDNLLYDVSSELEEGWFQLVAELGLPRMELQAHLQEDSFGSSTQRAFQALKQWRRKSGHGPLHYLPQLVEALKNTHYLSLAGIVAAMLQEYRQNLSQVTVQPTETFNIERMLKWALPQAGRFYCQGSDLQVITPYPLYITSVNWSAEPWRYGSDWVPVGQLFHFQFRCDDATEPVEIDFPPMVELADGDVMVACMNDHGEHELLPTEQVKPGQVTALLKKDARVGPVGRRSAVCAALQIGDTIYGPPHDLKNLEETLSSMRRDDLSKTVRSMFRDHVSSMDMLGVLPDATTDQSGVTKFSITLPSKGAYICKETHIVIVTSCPMTMMYHRETLPNQWEHQDHWIPVGPMFSVECNVPEDGPAEILLPHILHLSSDGIMDVTKEEAKVVHITGEKEEMLPSVVTPTHFIFRRCKGTWVFAAVKRALGMEIPRKGLFAMFKSSWASHHVDMKAFIVSNTKGIIKTLQDDLGDLCEAGQTFSMLYSRACTVMPEQTYCLHANVENGTKLVHDPEPPSGILYEDTLGDGTYPQMFEITIKRSSDGTTVKLTAWLRPEGEDGHDTCKMIKFLEPPNVSHKNDVPPSPTSTPLTGSTKPLVLLIIDVYGTSEGESSSINYQLAQDLIRAGANVCCAVIRASRKQITSAENNHVKLIMPFQEQDDTRDPSLDWLTFDHRVRYPDLPDGVCCVIGHADITDKAAWKIKDDRYPQAQLININHVIPEDTEPFKGYEQAMKAWQKQQELLMVAENANAVFSVGKRIYNHYETLYKGYQPFRDHHVFLPRPSEVFIATKVRPGGEQKVVLTAGGVRDVEKLKGHDLAARSMGRVAEKIKDVKLRVRGISEDDWETSRKILTDNLKSGRLIPTLLPCGTQEEISNDMKMAHLFLMPSRSEPFGLVGLEAIAAGIPVLISDKSGLAELIMDLIKEKKCHADRRHRIVETSVNDSDLDADAKKWADKILDTLENLPSEFQKAAEFKRELIESKYWEESNRAFLQACRITT